MIELKRCPFCGSKAEIIRDKTFNAETGEALTEPMCFVWCIECSALVSGATEDEAVGLWNRRAVDVEKQCLSCRHWLGTICEFRPWATGEACADWEVLIKCCANCENYDEDTCTVDCHSTTADDWCPRWEDKYERSELSEL